MIRHILVQQRYEAEDILKLLARGEKFEALAKKFSLCSSAKEGGSLGNIDRRRLDADFREALDRLKIGEVSGIVRTRFGYHILRLEE